MTRAEQETIIRWDQEEQTADLWTAYEPEANEWRKAGVKVDVDQMRDGKAISWCARVPKDAIRYRRVQDGQVVKRVGHRKGRLLGVRGDQFVDIERGTGLSSRHPTGADHRVLGHDELIVQVGPSSTDGENSDVH